MLGSFQDAEDALQDTLLAAWQGLGGFEGRASIRTWLYRIATDRCYERASFGQPAASQGVGYPGVNRPSRRGSARSYGSSLSPTPSSRARSACRRARRLATSKPESISLAFVTALQTLPPRQLAVLILRDVLGFHASEVAGMLDSTVESVNSALKRPRAGLAGRRPANAGREPPPAPGSPAEDAIVARFVKAYEAADVDALVALLTDDVFTSMPPIPLEYEGRDAVIRFFASVFGSAGGSTSCRREPTATRRSAPTWPPQTAASATGWASSPSPSPATGSAP